MGDAEQTQKSSASWSFEVDKINNWAYWDEAFTPEECQLIINFANQYKKHEGGISNINTPNHKIRDSKIVWILPQDETSWMYKRLTNLIMSLNENYFKFDLFGFMEGFQFTEYQAPTGHYGTHIDNIFDGPVRKLSMTIQLSDPKNYEGGELLIHVGSQPESMTKKQGTLICFPSYVLHEVTPVTKGKRYSLVGWITGKPFK
jgi:PKHD-type hydroxylase